VNTVRELLATGRARLVFDGPAGIGKTALLRVTADLAAASGATVLWARGRPHERDFAFGVVRGLFRSHLAALSEKDSSALLSDLAGPAAAVVLPESTESAEVETFVMLHALYWLTVRLTERRPLLLVVDDLHWADTASLRWLLYLARRADALPLVIAAGWNTGEPGTDPELLGELAEALTPVPVGALTRDEALELTTGRFGREPGPEFLTACLRATGGNPFLLHSIATAFAAEGLAPDEEGVGLLADLGPSDVSEWVHTSMSRGSADAVELAKALVVLGDGTDLSTAAALSGLTLDAAGEAADVLSALRFLAGDHPLRFVHTLVRNAVDHAIAPAERLAAQGKAARLRYAQRRPAEEIAAHLLAGDDLGEPWITAVLRDGARTATRRGAPDVAVTYLRRALREPASGEDRVPVLIELGQAELAVDLSSSVAHLTEAFDLTEDPETLCRIAAPLASAMIQRGDVRAAAELLDRAVARIGPGHAELVDRLEAISLVHRRRVFEPDRENRATRLAESPRTGNRRIALATLAVDEALSGGSRAKAVELVERVLALGPPTRFCMVANSLAAGAAVLAGRLDLADDCAAGLFEFAHTTGLPAAAEWAHYVVSGIASEEGRPVDTLEELMIGVEIEESINGTCGHAYFHAARTEALLDLGDLGGVTALLDELGATGPVAESVLSARGRHRMLTGDVGGALADQLAHGRNLARAGIVNPATSDWRSRAALAHHRLGQAAEAKALAVEEVELARGWGAPRPLGIALRTLGIVADDVEPLLESAAVLGASTAKLELARTLLYLGLAQHRRGQVELARSVLRQGYRLATDRGATAVAGELGAAVILAGGRRPRVARAAVQALTAQQRRIAELAAAGATNREIAERHYLSLRTVEHHLTGAYRVLGVEGREELATALATTENP
jgi:DNA-binding CsgD family transcriptional regulator